MQNLIASIILAACLTLTTCSEYVNLGAEPGDEQLMIQARQAYAEKQYEASYKNLYHLANKNNKEAMYALGYLYYYGLGVESNPKIAQDLIRQSADQGYKPAMKALRLFSATKSTFTVDNYNQSYIADYSPPKSTNKKKTPLALNTSTEEVQTTLPETTTESAAKAESLIKELAQTADATKPTTIENHAKNSNTTVERTYKLPNITIFKSRDIIKTNELLTTASNKKQNTSANNSWLNSQQPNKYTIQITTSKDQTEIEKFISHNNLTNKANTYSYLSNNEIWYGAGYGVYDNPSEAYKALSEMPINSKSRKPWVRQFKNITPSAVG